MNKLTITIIGIIVAAGIVALLLLYPAQKTTTDLAILAQTYCEQDNVAGVEISRSAGMIKVLSAHPGGGATHYPEDGGQPVECPVTGPDSVSNECRAIADVTDWEIVCSNTTEAPSHEEAERTAYNFILNFIEAAPPEPDQEAIDEIMNVLSENASASISRETVSSDLARFISVQDVPDQGASVEDLQIQSPTQAYLVVGLNYSGGRELRNVHLVVEDGMWKVDRVSTPDEAEEFEREGNLTRNNPGMEPGIWYLVYEEPGRPAQGAQLEFDAASICANDDENTTCDPETLETGTRAYILGEQDDNQIVRVIRLELR